MIYSKKTILIFISAAVLFICFGFIQKVDAQIYYATGTFSSTNLLEGQTVNSIEYFGWNATTTATTTIKVQFSQDNINWYSATSTPNTWNTLANGDNLATSTALSLSGWSAEPNFYYKMLFETADTSQTPVLGEIKLWYNLGTYPTVTTQAATNITTSTAVGHGNITNIGESSVIERGFQYDVVTSTSPAYSVSETGVFGTGAFSLSLTGLYAHTTYYVRAFAKNSRGTAYGPWLSFTTKSFYYSSGTLISKNILEGQGVSSIDKFGYNATSVPAGTTLKVQFSQDNINWYSSAGTAGGWDILSQGDHLVEESAIDLSALGWSGGNFYYKMQFDSNSPVNDASPILDEIRVYFTPGPSVSTQTPADITFASVMGQGEIVALSGGNATVRGFQYGLTETPTWEVSEIGSFGIGVYSLEIAGLSPNTTYYIRAFAINPGGTGYGNWISFTTSAYYSSGFLVSTNLLDGRTVTNISTFFSSSTVPAGTSLKIQFSTDQVNWYSADNVLGQWTHLPDGQFKTIIYRLGWATPNFYYKIRFETNAPELSPILDEIQLNYNIFHSPRLRGTIRIRGGVILSR